ncbi:unnamed protein product [Cochlearia groenlandica]
MKENSFVWFVKALYRLLVMARDAYIRSITSCSGAGILTGGDVCTAIRHSRQSGGSSAFGQVSGNFQICDPPNTSLPRSFTLARDQDCNVTRGDQSMAVMRQSPSLDRRRNNRYFVVLGRIDEEISCDDDEEDQECENFQK